MLFEIYGANTFQVSRAREMLDLITAAVCRAVGYLVYIDIDRAAAVIRSSISLALLTWKVLAP